MNDLRNQKVELILSIIALLGIFIALAWSVYQALDTPEVVFSWSTGKCLEVNYMDGTKGDCNNLPEKYDHVWGR